MSDILNTDLTSKDIDGTGIFDELMDAVNLRIEKEYNKKTLLQSDFSKVYLGAMQTTLSQSIAFLLEKGKAGKEEDLIAAQILKVEQETSNAALEAIVISNNGLQIAEETLLTRAKISLINAQTITEGIRQTELTAKVTVLNAQVTQMAQELLLTIEKTAGATIQNTLTASQKLKVDKDIEVSTQQIINMQEELDVITAKVTNLGAQTAKTNMDTTVSSAQQDKLTQDVLNMQQQVTNMVQERLKSISETSLLDQRRLNEIQTNTVLIKQQSKILAETNLLTAKKATEDWQIGTTGTLTRQSELYVAQKDGFARDAEQKAAKLLIDTWNVRRSTDTGTIADSTNKLADADIGAVVAKLKTGIGA